MKPLLGGKGANLAEMTRIGLPVPPGFTITTEVCTFFSGNGKKYPADLSAQVESALAKSRSPLAKTGRSWKTRCCFQSDREPAIPCRA